MDGYSTIFTYFQACTYGTPSEVRRMGILGCFKFHEHAGSCTKSQTRPTPRKRRHRKTAEPLSSEPAEAGDNPLMDLVCVSAAIHAIHAIHLQEGMSAIGRLGGSSWDWPVRIVTLSDTVKVISNKSWMTEDFWRRESCYVVALDWRLCYAAMLDNVAGSLTITECWKQAFNFQCSYFMPLSAPEEILSAWPSLHLWRVRGPRWWNNRWSNYDPTHSNPQIRIVENLASGWNIIVEILESSACFLSTPVDGTANGSHFLIGKEIPTGWGPQDS